MRTSSPSSTRRIAGSPASVTSGVDSAVGDETSDRKAIDWFRCVPFALIHLSLLSVIWVGVSWIAALVAAVVFAARVFGLTAFYHRYFSHRTFKTSRWFQFVGAMLGNAAAQRGPLWWASHHREHHRHSDKPEDVHSPHQHGFWWSHFGWFLTRESFRTNLRLVKDWAKFPELRWLDRFDYVVPLALAAAMFALGETFRWWAPGWGTNGMQMLVWGFLISTLCLYHVTYSVNSVAHKFGSRRFNTRDHSRNNFWLALVTFGEGWHNNHHRYPASARQGFVWWEIDVSFYVLVLLSRLGLVWGLKPVPARVLAEADRDKDTVTTRTSRSKPEVREASENNMGVGR